MKSFTLVSLLLNLLLLSNVEAIKGKQRKTARKPAIPRAAVTEEERFLGKGSSSSHSSGGSSGDWFNNNGHYYNGRTSYSGSTSSYSGSNSYNNNNNYSGNTNNYSGSTRYNNYAQHQGYYGNQSGKYSNFNGAQTYNNNSNDGIGFWGWTGFTLGFIAIASAVAYVLAPQIMEARKKQQQKNEAPVIASKAPEAELSTIYEKYDENDEFEADDDEDRLALEENIRRKRSKALNKYKTGPDCSMTM